MTYLRLAKNIYRAGSTTSKQTLGAKRSSPRARAVRSTRARISEYPKMGGFRFYFTRNPTTAKNLNLHMQRAALPFYLHCPRRPKVGRWHENFSCDCPRVTKNQHPPIPKNPPPPRRRRPPPMFTTHMAASHPPEDSPKIQILSGVPS